MRSGGIFCPLLLELWPVQAPPQVAHRTSSLSRYLHSFCRLEYLLLKHRNPNWWRSYNDVKHERQGHFASANLGNALDAMAGLFVLVSYLCEKELRACTALPWPQMLTLDPSLSSDIRTNLQPVPVLPDFAS
jgi:hypothetical protein